MDEFHINFNILGKYSDSTLGKRLSCHHRLRKEKERKVAKREKKNGVSLANYIFLLKNTMNGDKLQKDTLCEVFFFRVGK